MIKFIVVLFGAVALVSALPYPSTDDNEISSDEEMIDLSHLGESLFGNPDNETGKVVAEYNPETAEVNPEELGNYLEGDMLMPQSMARNGLSAVSSRWPGGVVPFEIRGNFGELRINFSLQTEV